MVTRFMKKFILAIMKWVINTIVEVHELIFCFVCLFLFLDNYFLSRLTDPWIGFLDNYFLNRPTRSHGSVFWAVTS